VLGKGTYTSEHMQAEAPSAYLYYPPIVICQQPQLCEMRCLLRTHILCSQVSSKDIASESLQKCPGVERIISVTYCRMYPNEISLVAFCLSCVKMPAWVGPRSRCSI
jgi:hypothetical protein